jgi:hypothetical protein
MATFGGIMRFRLADGSEIPVRGQFSSDLLDQEFDSVVNQNGSISRMATNTGFRAELAFEDGLGPADWKRLYAADNVSITMIEDTAAVQHIWTRANFVGKPVVDRMTGEVTGVSIVAQGYRLA